MAFQLLPRKLFDFLLFSATVHLIENVMEIPLIIPYPIRGHDFHKIPLPSFYQCAELCVALKLCRNMHYGNTGVCTLNSDGYYRQLREDSTGLRILQKESIPEGIGGVCRGHSCAIDEMCVQAGVEYTCVKHDFITVRCPEGWSRLYDVCIIVSLENRTWAEANEHCASTGAELLTLDTETNYQSIVALIYFQIAILTRRDFPSEKIWTGVPYSQDLPTWMPTKATTTSNTNLCMSVHYNWTTVKDDRKLHIGIMEAVNCNEKIGLACQHRAPDNWP